MASTARSIIGRAISRSSSSVNQRSLMASSSRGMTPHVLYERHGHTALITINRPEVRNCIGPQTHRELKAAWQRFLDEDDAYVGVLTGAGDQSFCAGGDLKA